MKLAEIKACIHALNRTASLSPKQKTLILEKKEMLPKILADPLALKRTITDLNLKESGMPGGRSPYALDMKGIFEEYSKLDASGIKIILPEEKIFPKALKEIPDPPRFLYIRGEESVLENRSLAVVGTRKASMYAKQVIWELIPPLSPTNLVIVSGMALGVDAEALDSALAVGLKTIAVLGSGLSNSDICPRTNFQLSQRILKNGCLVSEYPPGDVVFKQNFLRRNRIISGLALGTLVIEAPSKSGSLVTALSALEQNRSVMAVPGSIFSGLSKGCLKLIQSGAKLVSSSSDIIEELNLDLPENKDAGKLMSGSKPLPFAKNYGSEEERMLFMMSSVPLAADELIRKLKLPAPKVLQMITSLEMAGRIKNINGYYVKIS
jgi:DNA processing protein